MLIIGYVCAFPLFLSFSISLSLFPVDGYFQIVADYLNLSSTSSPHVIPLQTNSDIDSIETFLLIIIDRKEKERERKREREKTFFFFFFSQLSLQNENENVILSSLNKFSKLRTILKSLLVYRCL